MSRVVTYLTQPASDANAHVRMGRAMTLWVDMISRGFSSRSSDARECMDYAIESPDEIPAGACRQYEIDVGDEDNGLPGYCVSAQQITVSREDL